MATHSGFVHPRPRRSRRHEWQLAFVVPSSGLMRISSTRVATRIGLAQLRTKSDFDDASVNSRVACSAVDPLGYQWCDRNSHWFAYRRGRREGPWQGVVTARLPTELNVSSKSKPRIRTSISDPGSLRIRICTVVHALYLPFAVLTNSLHACITDTSPIIY